MFKRLLLVAAGALLFGQALIVSVQFVQGRGLFPSSELSRRSSEYRQVLELVHDHYVDAEAASYDKLSETALDNMLRSLDPHSEFLSEREFISFREDTSQEFGGIGVQIEIRDHHLTVVAPIEGTPGARAGLMRGDQFIAVDGENVENRSLNECLDLLRGKPGTEVKLTLRRTRTDEMLERTITREIIKVESVRDTHMLDDSIGYLRIIQFGERTGEEFLEAVESLEAKGMKALVLDLRDNPGGLLDAAVLVAQPYFKKGELVAYTQGRDPSSRDDIHARPEGPTRTYPIAVLINSGSASASEIVAGTLHDTGRAVLVGEKSFGKGSVQTILSVMGGKEAIRLTTALYYLPSGLVINGRGLEPDIPITLSVDEDRKLAIQRNRLALMTSEEFKKQFDFDPIADRQLDAARGALEGVLAVDRLGMLAQ